MSLDFCYVFKESIGKLVTAFHFSCWLQPKVHCLKTTYCKRDTVFRFLEWTLHICNRYIRSIFWRIQCSILGERCNGFKNCSRGRRECFKKHEVDHSSESCDIDGAQVFIEFLSWVKFWTFSKKGFWFFIINVAGNQTVESISFQNWSLLDTLQNNRFAENLYFLGSLLVFRRSGLSSCLPYFQQPAYKVERSALFHRTTPPTPTSRLDEDLTCFKILLGRISDSRTILVKHNDVYVLPIPV